MTTYPSRVSLIEVGPRDGLQNEATPLSVADKIQLIDALSKTGLSHIECGSFVSPKWVPQMAHSDAVLDGIVRQAEITYSALVPNQKGFENCVTHNPNEIAIFTAASNEFTQKNINCTITESLSRFELIMRSAQTQKLPVRGYISTVISCPYQGKVDPKMVLAVAKELLALGCYEISLGDTIGVGTPRQVAELLEVLLTDIPVHQIAVHFHNTYGQAIANISKALEYGVSRIDSAIAGLGGCPYAKGASGNIATEDVVYLLDGLGIQHGVDLKRCVKIGRNICKKLNKPPPSLVNQAYL
ncbi:MAG: hydroxymethylglutaryl-CoA lyase [Alteromonadaceae bacterium]|nr:hydroxymethylglutaryl-CoA lyase [Alteromonadaceae bacterium]